MNSKYRYSLLRFLYCELRFSLQTRGIAVHTAGAKHMVLMNHRRFEMSLHLGIWTGMCVQSLHPMSRLSTEETVVFLFRDGFSASLVASCAIAFGGGWNARIGARVVRSSSASPSLYRCIGVVSASSCLATLGRLHRVVRSSSCCILSLWTFSFSSGLTTASLTLLPLLRLRFGAAAWITSLYTNFLGLATIFLILQHENWS